MNNSRDELLKRARARLYPSLRNPHYLVLRSRRLLFEAYVRTLPHELQVLDVGGWYQPYRPLLDGKNANYFALDVQKSEFVNVLGSGEQIPFRDGTFDLAIAT